jgi:hypothetical protein
MGRVTRIELSFSSCNFWHRIDYAEIGKTVKWALAYALSYYLLEMQ